MPPPKPVLEASDSEAQKMGRVLSVPVSSEENDRAWTNWGKRIIGGGVQNLF